MESNGIVQSTELGVQTVGRYGTALGAYKEVSPPSPAGGTRDGPEGGGDRGWGEEGNHRRHAGVRTVTSVSIRSCVYIQSWV